jgi:hypothetical protein
MLKEKKKKASLEFYSQQKHPSEKKKSGIMNRKEEQGMNNRKGKQDVNTVSIDMCCVFWGLQ